LSIPRGAISPFDHLFKKYAAEIGWDWRLLAAIAFHESGFDSSQISRRGASGLMQLMPRTAANFGLSRANITNPEKNIEAGVQYIKSLNLLYRKVEDPDERKKFILASYNSGPAHILDAMELARKHGKNPYVWHEHVEVFLEKKSDPEYYKDEVVKYGRFRAAETIRYVRNTLSTYQKFKGE
jgi:membrane-bound lytic murein transglycosylase F